MKACLICLCLLPTFSFAQKEAGGGRSAWQPGLYGNISAGYTWINRPFENSAIGFPYTSVAATGGLAKLGGGFVFRNRLGIGLALAFLSAENVSTDPSPSLSGIYPEQTIAYTPIDRINNQSVGQFSIGLTYAFPNRRWCFQPEIWMGSSEVFVEEAVAIVKENGSNQATIIRFIPKNPGKRSPVWNIGGRMTWNFNRYFGLLADAHFSTRWHNVKFEVEKTALIEQTTQPQTLQLRQTTYGAAVSIGIFLQLIRW